MDTVKFKVGDLVECIEESNHGDHFGLPGVTYKVREPDYRCPQSVFLAGLPAGCTASRFRLVSQTKPTSTVRQTQVGGDHYHTMGIQPFEYALANNLGALEHTAIKYLSRWQKKGGVQDLKKAVHAIEFLIEYTEKNGVPT